jgi:hypothetical protein
MLADKLTNATFLVDRRWSRSRLHSRTLVSFEVIWPNPQINKRQCQKWSKRQRSEVFLLQTANCLFCITSG